MLSIDGTGFAPDATVQLVAGTTTIDATSVTVSPDGTHIDAQIGPGAQPGTVYDVVVSNASCADAEPHLQVTASAGAFMYLADPRVVYSGITTGVTVYATSLAEPLATDALQMIPSGATDGTALDFTQDATKPNHLHAVVPSGVAAGDYDLRLVDAVGCETTLSSAISVTNDLAVTIASVDPPFADAAAYTSVTVTRDTTAVAPADVPFEATPRLFLNPSSGGTGTVAIPIQSVSFIDMNTLTAVIPANQTPGDYDLIVVNPDGSVGLLAAAVRIQATPPPMVATATPSSIVNATGQTVSLAGTSFSPDAVVTTSCHDSTGAPVATAATNGTPVCVGLDCTVDVTIDASALDAGSVCVARVTNGDGSFFDFSALGVTNASLNLGNPVAGTDMNTARRALVAAAGNATASSRFIYAIGGDGGASVASAPFASVESAPVDAYGTVGTFRNVDYSPLSTPRAFAAGATLGRYIYVTGGTDGTNVLASGERAMILDPVEVPHIDVGDMVPADTGLDAGTYVYTVSAVFGATDPDNPNGESLPSDELAVRVPTVDGKKLQVVIEVTPPTDRLGAAIPGVVGYRVYRSPTNAGVSGDARLLGTIPTGETTFTDDGSLTTTADAPLVIGSLGKWAPLPDMVAPREGHATAIAADPATQGTYYLYDLLGVTTGGTTTTSYEYLTITEAPNGHQTVAAAFQDGGGSVVSAQGRWQIGAWVANSTTSSNITSPNTFVYVGGGVQADGSTSAPKVEAGLVTAGGALASFDDTPTDFSSPRAGYGLCGANGQLYAFGGLNAAPSDGAGSAVIGATPPGLSPGAWNNEGLVMQALRYLMGSSVQSAFIFLVGGETDVVEATTSTERVIW